ncbi:hypothetical protein AB5N19_03570 [Seiridium cardinale]|uniref:Uncharacterized protein n=1 Tax=Seiridium cardinale TaxID=138064 RepID=A0ABR2Y2G8_9PEZI
MQFSTAILSTIALLGVGQAFGAAIEIDDKVAAREALIATTPYYACNCPNNCKYKSGTGCRYYAGPSGKSKVLSGKCSWVGSSLTCIDTA